MSEVHKFSRIQKERFIQIYNDPKIATKDIPKIIESEMNIVVPMIGVKTIYNNVLNMPLRKRPRKNTDVEYEFEEEEESENESW